jgi:hypothetical protein
MMQTHTTIEGIEGEQVGFSRWGGVSLMVLGGILFVMNVLSVSLENWWALFILLPALILFNLGWRVRRAENGRFPFLARFNFAVGLIIFVVAVMFLINLNWLLWWPLMLIVPGFALIIASGKGSENPTAAAWIGYLRSTAITIIGLGMTFLAHTLGAINLDTVELFQWWGVFIAVPALGALWQAVRLYGRLGHLSPSVVTLLIIALWSSVTAVMELLGFSWEIWHGSWSVTYQITAVSLIISGIVLVRNGLHSQS